MILEYNGQQVNFSYPQVKKACLYLSGGADSALILYLLSKTDIEIYPVNGYDITTPDIDSPTCAKNIINYVKNKSPNAKINDLLIYPYQPNDVSKYSAMRPMRNYLEQQYGVNYWIFGTSLGMPHEDRPTNDVCLVEFQKKYKDVIFPWATVNKRFIAEQYKKFNIENLSLITNSCIQSGITPCKKCWWCKERFWAFGSYDGGIQ